MTKTTFPVKKLYNSNKYMPILKLLFKAYFFLNEINFGNFIRSREVMKNLKVENGEKIFDAGCGVGLYSLRAAYKNARVVGGDLFPLFKYPLKLFDTKLLKNIDFIILDLNHIPIKSETFDKIVCVNVLEHIPSDENVIAEFGRILKNNGELLVHVPNSNRYAMLKTQEKQKQIQLEKTRFGHVRNGYTLEQLTSLLKKNNIRAYDHTYTFGFWSRIAQKSLL